MDVNPFKSPPASEFVPPPTKLSANQDSGNFAMWLLFGINGMFLGVPVLFALFT